MIRHTRAVLISLLAVAMLAAMPISAFGAIVNVTGTVIDGADETPLGGIRVRAWYYEDAWAGNLNSPVRETVTAGDGTYTLPMVPDDYHVYAFIDETGTYRDMTAYQRGLPPRDAFALPPGDTTKTIDVSLYKLQHIADERTYRVSGANRYSTAIAISADNWRTSEHVVIASGKDFPDALAAAPLAGALEAPILLTPPSSLPAGLTDEIERLGADKITIIGGTGAVSAAVENALASASGASIRRLAGSDRYATAGMVAREVVSLNTDDGLAPRLTFICRGDAFPDALAASPFAYANRMPILLTRPSYLPQASAFAWNQISAANDGVYIIGGLGAVMDAVVQDLADTSATYNVGYARFAGANRYATAADLVSGWRDIYDAFGLATGTSFPDALAGGAASGRWDAALLLTPSTSLSGDAAGVLANSGPYVVDMQAYGGTAALTDSTVNAADAALGNQLYDIDDADNRVSVANAGSVFTSEAIFGGSVWPTARTTAASLRELSEQQNPRMPDRPLTSVAAQK